MTVESGVLKGSGYTIQFEEPNPITLFGILRLGLTIPGDSKTYRYWAKRLDFTLRAFRDAPDPNSALITVLDSRYRGRGPDPGPVIHGFVDP